MIPIKDTIPNSCRPVMTWSLMLFSLAIFLFQQSLALSEIQVFIIQYGFIPGEFSFYLENNLIFTENFALVILSLFTYTFLHGSWGHLILNIWSLWIFGDNVEDVFGKIGFLIFYLLGGALAGLAHYAFNAGSLAPVVGGSGAIAGVMGAYALMYPHSRILTVVPLFWIPLFFRIPAFIFMGIWILTQIFLGVMDLGSPDVASGVAWWAHIGGFTFGILVVTLFKNKIRIPNYSEMYYK